MKEIRSILVAVLALVANLPAVEPAVSLEAGWNHPPPEARLRAYWWWPNGNVTRDAITRDLEQMKAKGFGGAVIMDAGGADQGGHAQVPHGPTFGSPAWRELFKHTLREASRLGLEISLNIQSGWNLGGPMVTPEDTVKKLTWSETVAKGPGRILLKLSMPATNDGYYRDLYVLAWREPESGKPSHPPLRNLPVKTLQKKPAFDGPNAWFLANSSPDTAAFLFDEEPSHPGEEDTHTADVIDLTKNLSADGTLTWQGAPAGSWRILRVGATLGDHRRVSTSSEGWSGYALDVLDAGAFHRYWDAVVQPLIDDAGSLAGKTLRYLHTDSWEVDEFNWTPTLREEFRQRRGYDLLPWLPVFSGRIVESREQSDRFLNDFRRTMGDLAAANHYQLFKDAAARYGIGIHPESGGPHFTAIDAQQCLGINDVPMAEFWAESTTHRTTDEVRFFVKQPASAAHTTGKRLVAAEGFTTVGPQWQERLWNNLKPSFDEACTEGLNRLVWHAFVCSPKDMGVPGQQYFAGTHLNPNVTWWEKSAPFFLYLNRCQFLLQQGLPVADALYYYGDQVPNYAQLRRSDPARLGRGYDYDVISADALLSRVSVQNGCLVLPDGMSYRVLVLPDHAGISLAVLKKVRELVQAGATVVGPKPSAANSLTDFPKSDAEVRRLADELWTSSAAGERVIGDRTAREVLQDAGVPPDFEIADEKEKTDLRYVHRRAGDTDLYFVANRAKQPVSIRATFRVSGKAPELWDAVSGVRRMAPAFTEAGGRITLPLELPACGSVFVIFRQPSASASGVAASKDPGFISQPELDDAWTVEFDPRWGGPGNATFPQLVSWTTRSEPGICFYSGTAIYRKKIHLSPALAAKPLSLDLGDVRELAEVRLNGKSLGIVWAPPFRVDLAGAAKPGVNELEVEVVNFWPNRLIGDSALPPDKRLTKTNIRKFTPKSPLMDSGLLGPVRLLEKSAPEPAPPNLP